jgi:hypothetical protein
MANRLLAERNTGRVGTCWALNFIKRQPQLTIRFNRKYDYQRAKCEDLKLISEWFALIRNIIIKYRIIDIDIYNFDETGFIIGVILIVIVVTSSERSSRAKAIQPSNRE